MALASTSIWLLVQGLLRLSCSLLCCCQTLSEGHKQGYVEVTCSTKETLKSDLICKVWFLSSLNVSSKKMQSWKESSASLKQFYTRKEIHCNKQTLHFSFHPSIFWATSSSSFRGIHPAERCNISLCPGSSSQYNIPETPPLASFNVE